MAVGICGKGCLYHSRVGSSESCKRRGWAESPEACWLLPDRNYLLKSPEHPNIEPLLGEHMCHALMNEKISIPINGWMERFKKVASNHCGRKSALVGDPREYHIVWTWLGREIEVQHNLLVMESDNGQLSGTEWNGGYPGWRVRGTDIDAYDFRQTGEMPKSSIVQHGW